MVPSEQRKIYTSPLIEAKVVLTSNDPEYHTKVGVITQILSDLKEDEAFYSIDEYGPFAIKRKGGVKRVGPGED